MIRKEIISDIERLYRKIFGEDANNSKEFIIFATGNPHPLRIKVEEEIAKVNDKLTDNKDYYSKEEIDSAFGLSGVGELVYKQFNIATRRQLEELRDALKELEKIIMEVIENNLEG